MTSLSPSARLRAAATVVRRNSAGAHQSPESLWCPQVAEALASWLESEADLVEDMGSMVALLSSALAGPGQGEGEATADAQPSDRALALADQILAVTDVDAVPDGWSRRWGLREWDGVVTERYHEGAPLFTEDGARQRAAARLDRPTVVTRLLPPWLEAPAR